MSRFPDFICPGMQKCGTTWLHANLSRHPQLWLPPIKEVNYFNELYFPSQREWIQVYRNRHLLHAFENHELDSPDFLRRLASLTHTALSQQNDAWYAGIFEYAPPSKKIGEVTPGYANLPAEGIRHVKRLVPEAKILILLRDPIERAWSHARHLIKHNDHELDTIFTFKELWEWCDYPTILRAWRHHFAYNVHVFNYHDIARMPAELLAKITSVLGVDDSFAFPQAEQRVFAGDSMDMPEETYAMLKERLRGSIEEFAGMHPGIGEAWLRKHYD